MRNLIISIMIHLVIAVVIYQNLKDQKDNTVTVTDIQFPKEKTQGTVPQVVVAQKKVQAQKQIRILPRLGVDPMESERSSDAMDAQLVTSDGFEVANQMDMEREDGVYPYLKYLHEKIENTLLYPENLVKKSRMGLITIQFEVNQRGRLVGDLQAISSEDPKLATVIRAQLMKVLEEPLNSNIRLPVKAFRVVTTFDFRIFTHEELMNKKVPTLVKNVLYFYPYAIRDRAVVRASGQASSGYTIGVDALKIKETIQN